MFADKPEKYHDWKQTFKHVISETDANPSEEMDLLLKWLGPISNKNDQ